MNVLFIIPDVERRKQWGRWHRGAGNNSFNYGIACVATYLREKGFNVSLVDCQFLGDVEKELSEIILHRKIDLIGISCFTPTYVVATRLASLCKRIAPHVKIVLGGPHPSLYPKDTLEKNKEVDFVVFGEGEYTLHELVKGLQSSSKDFSGVKGLGFRANGSVVVNQPREFIADMDKLPIPAYDIYPLEKYQIQVTSYKHLPTYTLVASRGCPFRCTFCQVQQFLGGTVRYKSPEKIIEELKYLKNNFHARGIMFQDSTFTSNWRWTREFCNLMVQEKMDLTWMCFTRGDRVNQELLELMKKAGCYGISYGVESAKQESVDLLKKSFKIEKVVESVELSVKMGFFVTATYMLGIPGEDEEDVKRTINLANRLATQIAHFYLPIPYPESELFYQCKADGGLREDLRWEDFNMFDDSSPVYINPRIGKDKMLNLKNQAIRGYYLNPTVIYRNLKHINTLEDVRKYYTAAKALLGAYIS